MTTDGTIDLTTATERELALERNRQAKAKRDAERQAKLEAMEARKEAMRTTPEVRLGRPRGAVFNLPSYSEWLDRITHEGMQLMWVRNGTRLAVVVPDADWETHERTMYTDAQAGWARPFLAAIEAIGPDHDLTTPPPCDLCGERQAQRIAADQLVVCSEDCSTDRPGLKPKRIGNRRSTRKASSGR